MNRTRHCAARTLWATVIAMLALLACGCKSQNDKVSSGATEMPRGSNVNFDRLDISAVQRSLMTFADRFCSVMADEYDLLQERATTPAAKAMALDRKIGNITGAMNNAVNASPLVGVIDMMVMVSLLRQTSEDPWFTELFGKDAEPVVIALRKQEDEIWLRAERCLPPSHIAEIRGLIEQWRRDNPNQRYVGMVRLSDFPQAKGRGPEQSVKGPGSVFRLLFLDPLAGLDPAVRAVEQSRETVERMFFYARRTPNVVHWQAESLYMEMMQAPQFATFLDETNRFTQSTHNFADATKEVAVAVQQFPKFMTEERERAVEQVAKSAAEQRDSAVRQVAQAVATERDAAIRQLNDAVAVQRDGAIRQIATALSTERDAAITQATTRFSSERTATLAEVDATISAQRAGITHELEMTTRRLIDRFFWLELIVVSAGAILVIVAMVVYRALFRNVPAAVTV